MNDLRQGVTETQHQVLDLIEAKAPTDSWPSSFEDRLRAGRALAADATRFTRLEDKRKAAIEAAALLIDAADEIARLIDPSTTP